MSCYLPTIMSVKKNELYNLHLKDIIQLVVPRVRSELAKQQRGTTYRNTLNLLKKWSSPPWLTVEQTIGCSYKDLDRLLDLCCSVCTLASGWKLDNRKFHLNWKKRNFKQISALKFILFHYGKKDEDYTYKRRRLYSDWLHSNFTALVAFKRFHKMSHEYLTHTHTHWVWLSTGLLLPVSKRRVVWEFDYFVRGKCWNILKMDC